MVGQKRRILMNILVLTNKMPFPPRDGGSIATLNMLNGLHKAGNKVSCLALNTSKHYFPVAEIPEQIRENMRILSARCDTGIRALDLVNNFLFSRRPYIAQRFDSKEFRAKLKELLEKEDFDLIQMEGPYLAQYMDLVRKKSKAIISFRAHNVEHKIWLRKASHESRTLLRWYIRNLALRIRNLEIEVARQSDCLVPISEVDAAFFREASPGKAIRVVPAGLRLEDYPFTLLPEKPSCFFIGALDWLPNQEGLRWFLDHVFPRMRESYPGICFHVAGRNAPPAISRMLEQDGIHYYGEVEEAIAFMKDQNIMVAPLLTGSGIRIKILEAMALGKPVITTPIGIEGIPARKDSEVCIAGSPEEFQTQLNELFGNEKLRSELRKNGRKLVQENFDTFELSKQVTEFFRNLR